MSKTFLKEVKHQQKWTEQKNPLAIFCCCSSFADFPR